MYMYQAAASFTGDLGEAAFLVQSRSGETFSRFRHTSTDSIRLLGLKGGCVTDRHQTHTASISLLSPIQLYISTLHSLTKM